MYNMVILVGRLEMTPTLENDVIYTTLEVPRANKSDNNEYESDYIKCVFSKSVASRVNDYCKKGDLLAIKGTVKSKYYNIDNDIRNTTYIDVERVTFLQTRRDKNEK